jgi:hypothetical protein
MMAFIMRGLTLDYLIPAVVDLSEGGSICSRGHQGGLRFFIVQGEGY